MSEMVNASNDFLVEQSRTPLPMDSPEIQDWIAAKKAFRDAAVRLGCIDGGIAPGPGLNVDALHQEHSEAALKFHISTVRVLELCKNTEFAADFPSDDIEGMSIDVAMARSLALKRNEQRLTIEADAVDVMLRSVRSEMAGLRDVIYPRTERGVGRVQQATGSNNP
ncbi:hypothetical protein C8T65DRAFT_828700 [Cerioporus squamosus]|nr:hypothetical protein C8T65DRAFT_828700 [Cerioporus squamosus]